MKNVILAISLALIAGGVYAQRKKTTNDYLVKTKFLDSVKQADSQESADNGSKKRKTGDFVNDNFEYLSLCDWKEGMRFMVLPEKYDLIVNTFKDASGNDVSSVRLRHHIFRYKNHAKGGNDKYRVNFIDENNGQPYFFEIPNGTFDDYCDNKLGVPTLAYLDDVDIADSLLLGKRLFTRAKKYYRDSYTSGDAAEEISIPDNREVKVVAVGVGTRNFPVKIIVQSLESDSTQFYQNVAISRTNCGMRDNEFIMDNIAHTFNGAFGLMDGLSPVSDRYTDYIGAQVFTKVGTKMLNEKSNKQQGVPRMTGFMIESIHPKNNSDYVTLRLKNNTTAGYFLKDVTFVSAGDYTDTNGDRDDYFGYLFAEGTGKAVSTTSGSRAMINVGHVGTGFSEDEVVLAVGDAEKIEQKSEGRYNWLYQRSNGKILVVEFGSNNTVIGTSTRNGFLTPEAAKAAAKNTKKYNRGKRNSASKNSSKRK